MKKKDYNWYLIIIMILILILRLNAIKIFIIATGNVFLSYKLKSFYLKMK
jgi:hypothetical protein